MKKQITPKSLSFWLKTGRAINPYGRVPHWVFVWIKKRIPLTAFELALVHPDKKQIYLTYRSDQYFQGWHLPGSFLYFRESWTKACWRIINKEITTDRLKIDKLEFLTAFNFFDQTQDPYGHSNSLLFLVYLNKAYGKFKSIKKGRFFSTLPKDILQIKLSKTLNKNCCLKPTCTSHEIMFKAALGHLTHRKDWLNTVKTYQNSFC